MKKISSERPELLDSGLCWAVCLLILSTCISGCSEPTDEQIDSRSALEFQIIEHPRSQNYDQGTLKFNMSSVDFSIPLEKYQVIHPGGVDKAAVDVVFCWRSDSKTSSRECGVGEGYLVRIKFRVTAEPSLGYTNSLNEDYAEKYFSGDKGRYDLRASSEYSDLKEFYLIELKTSHRFLLEYRDLQNGREVEEIVNCTPGFREREKIYETHANGQCSIGYWLTPLVHAKVRFDSRVVHQIKEFEKAVHAIINEFTLISFE